MGMALAWLLWNEWFWRDLVGMDGCEKVCLVGWSRGWVLMVVQGQAGRHDKLVNEAKMIDDDKRIPM